MLNVVPAGAREVLDAPTSRTHPPAFGQPWHTLPLTEVVLYSSGVGYFRREGRVEGSAQVDLRFKVDEINDLLALLCVNHS